ncbi:MAG: hypothetical protein UR39_C0003G0166 [Candidatus Woesebacteria bacterium GW2011_GWA1_33_30]|uniref:AB hydrolase-1 domain-containing protein n=1 Tax=Candidatus Woesebacteria bacterium GW2011_GWA2_33_28 TaxID=1618561 RepID=A0A0F9ZU31_9BACT|nr:MAG: hypothetical protein UR38_C0003G0169 [Candidatus Woesebacteria bacterium GW2011_GWA2_33_28]KKP48631.1 MAG: hypothetical protein UR39_C0003G0166 [Candidatus Woesebacteria bacterium GW2011_GWA1_33_30]KKP49770.1 MAG: hypothetical protein UR40_C0004G0169 [Microgenomates group bacterium GW2011_GWC1_33_32]KKP52387.1 MAG: hypothetical protein UR44_C0003G0169 [Candidatus Woesebacteria bacterium GW2011_GWB1_33_38]KKP56732.1 MAG: hypothetical protein UR48_C0030G0003 [Microgenomates group bacteriu
MILKIKNIFGEVLDVLIEGNKDSKNVVIFVHGFGTDKNEGFATFLDLANFLEDKYLTIRFDLSGYGASEGEDSEFQFQKAAGDLDSIIRYSRRKYPDKDINIIAHSLGTFITSLLSPHEIKKTVFTSVPNSNSEFVIKQLQDRIIKHGGTIDEKGITLYPRSSGAVQKMGKDFWRTFRNFDILEYIADFAKKTKIVIYKPKQDDVLEYKYFDEYKSIPKVSYIEVDGDHNFRKEEDRQRLFEKIKEFLDN